MIRPALRLAAALALAPVCVRAQTFAPTLAPTQPERQPGLMPLYQPQRLPMASGPAKPGEDAAFGAYQRGYYVTALREAMKRLDRDKNDSAAMTLIGEIYRDGFGVKKDPAEAVRWYKLAAERGNAQAQFALAAATLRGDGTPQDRARAKALLEQAAAQGHPGAYYNLGIMAIDNDIQDFKAAATWFRKAADGGNMDGAYSLAVLYREGRGVPQDLREAAKWLRRAADEHIAAAEVELGIMTFNGEGVPKDEAAAAKLFLSAASHNNPVAMNRVARLYASGRGLPKDEVQAMRWHLLARAVGLNDDWLDSVLNGLNAKQRAEVEDQVRRYVGQ